MKKKSLCWPSDRRAETYTGNIEAPVVNNNCIIVRQQEITDRRVDTRVTHCFTLCSPVGKCCFCCHCRCHLFMTKLCHVNLLNKENWQVEVVTFLCQLLCFLGAFLKVMLINSCVALWKCLINRLNKNMSVNSVVNYAVVKVKIE